MNCTIGAVDHILLAIPIWYIDMSTHGVLMAAILAEHIRALSQGLLGFLGHLGFHVGLFVPQKLVVFVQEVASAQQRTMETCSGRKFRSTKTIC